MENLLSKSIELFPAYPYRTVCFALHVCVQNCKCRVHRQTNQIYRFLDEALTGRNRTLCETPIVTLNRINFSKLVFHLSNLIEVIYFMTAQR